MSIAAGAAQQRACGSCAGPPRRSSAAVSAPIRPFPLCSTRRRAHCAIGAATGAGAASSSGAGANSGSSGSGGSGSGGGAGGDKAPRPPVNVYFKAEDVLTQAAPGDVIMEVAERCGITIPGGCYSGNCGICEVEVRKYSAGAAAGAPPPPGAVVRACVARLPPGYERVEIEGLPDDQLWGLDGFDT